MENNKLTQAISLINIYNAFYENPTLIYIQLIYTTIRLRRLVGNIFLSLLKTNLKKPLPYISNDF